MKAVVKTRPEPGNVEFIEVPDPAARAGQLVIEVKAAGVCGTDIHIYRSEYLIDPPVILGHEFSGEVVEVGVGVTRFHVGDRVTVNPSAGRLCGKCHYCRIGAPFFCIDRAALGSGMNGGFAKYCGVREEIVFPLPHGLDFDAGALCEPFACAVQATVELTEMLPGETVVVSGPGPIGILCMMLSKMHGSRVVMLGLSADASRLDLARRLGADAAVDVQTENAREYIDDVTEGYGADVVFECAGASASVVQCLDVVRKMGRYTQVGLLGGRMELDLDQIVKKQLHFQGSMCHTWSTWDRTMGLLGRGDIDLDPLITARLPLGRWEEGFQNLMDREGLKTVLHP